MGYESPMPVQEEVIPFLLGEDNDVIALAQTGTGKTAAYGLPILQKINVSQYQPQALILCPTRELCLQIADDLNDYSKYIDNLKVLPVYGGGSRWRGRPCARWARLVYGILSSCRWRA